MRSENKIVLAHMTSSALARKTTKQDTLSALLQEARHQIQLIQTQERTSHDFSNHEWAAALVALLCDAIAEQVSESTYQRMNVGPAPARDARKELALQIKDLLPVSDSLRNALPPKPASINECMRSINKQAVCYTHVLCSIVRGVLHSTASLDSQLSGQLDRVQVSLRTSRGKVASEHMRRVQYIQKYEQDQQHSIQQAVADRTSAAEVRRKLSEAQNQLYIVLSAALESELNSIIQDAHRSLHNEAVTVKNKITISCATSAQQWEPRLMTLCNQHFVVNFLDELHKTLANGSKKPRNTTVLIAFRPVTIAIRVVVKLLAVARLMNLRK